MYSKNILSFLTVGLLTLAKINGDVVDNYTGKCNEIYKYLEGQGKVKNIENCKTNDKGEVTELEFYPYCLENKQFETLLSYNTMESLVLLNLYNDDDIEFIYGCTSIPTNFEKLDTLTNLKHLDLSGVNNLDLISSVPESVETLKIDRVKLTQGMVDVISEMTNLKNLIFDQTNIDELNFDKFKNLKNLTYLKIMNGYMSQLELQVNLFKNLVVLKTFDLYECDFDKNILDSISNITTLEELIIDSPYISDEYDYFSFKKLLNV